MEQNIQCWTHSVVDDKDSGEGIKRQPRSCSDTNGHVNCHCLWQLVHVPASVTLLKCLDSAPGRRVGISNPGTLRPSDRRKRGFQG